MLLIGQASYTKLLSPLRLGHGYLYSLGDPVQCVSEHVAAYGS